MKTLIAVVAFTTMLLSMYSCKTSQSKQGNRTNKSGTETVITEKYWKLTELNGRPIATDANMRREPHIIFKLEENRVTGSGGCNNFSGTYELKEHNRITISKIMSTKMACQNMEVETQLFSVLEKADNYYLNGDTLVLNRARMAPLARFAAVYLK